MRERKSASNHVFELGNALRLGAKGSVFVEGMGETREEVLRRDQKS